jgi:DMSO/TMAO reductase YedYZ heme-binding membrane subunit
LKRIVLKTIGVLAILLITLTLGAVTYVLEFTETSISLSKPLQSLSGFTNPIRNIVGTYGFVSFILVFIMAILFARWLEFKDNKEIEKYNEKLNTEK